MCADEYRPPIALLGGNGLGGGGPRVVPRGLLMGSEETTTGSCGRTPFPFPKRKK